MKPTQTKDFYERWGIVRSASPEEIKKAYRKMALSWHPDRGKSPEAGEQFKAVSEAYGTLSDLRKKLIYDMFHPSATKPESPKQEPKASKHSPYDETLENIMGVYKTTGPGEFKLDPTETYSGKTIDLYL
ncbi:MAG: DnaJ domain-containing protein [Nanoarchaeota archaeon]|nr:DnaJ domain-containing protein [Nanoarchaeota archaeon]